jgi:hypothetical protein
MLLGLLVGGLGLGLVRRYAAGWRSRTAASPGRAVAGASPGGVGFRPRRRRARRLTAWRPVVLVLAGLGLVVVLATLLESVVPGTGRLIATGLAAAMPYAGIAILGLVLLGTAEVIGGSRF